jgi:hypothetical protein
LNNLKAAQDANFYNTLNFLRYLNSAECLHSQAEKAEEIEWLKAWAMDTETILEASQREDLIFRLG